MSTPTHNFGGYYEWGCICDICGQPRSKGSHRRCSKLRQAAKRKEQEARDGQSS